MKRIGLLITCFVLLYGCAAGGRAAGEIDSLNIGDRGVLSSDREPSAEALFDQAATLLTAPSGVNEDNSVKAREILNRMIRSYPDNKLRSPAEVLIVMIDRQSACREKIKAGLDGCSGVLDQKAKCEESETLCRQELTRILQENEQLKKDLQNLKNLEIELEQRNRVLR